MALWEFGLWDDTGYWLVRFVFRRGLALVYLLGFLVAARQFRPLCGEDGLVPIDNYVERTEFRDRPSIFYFYPSDRAVAIGAWIGVFLSLFALFGVTEIFGTPVSMASWFILWVLYLSFVNAGQVFYGFGWESMLVETGFLAIFLGSWNVAAPAIVVWLLRWVAFRNMFGAGLIKIRGDECWRDLTCLNYHYETQPMPNPVSWYIHHFPNWFHKFSVSVNHIVELVVPFFYFAPQPFAAVAGMITIGFQAWLMLTGNFSWLNFLTIVLAVPMFSDAILSPIVPLSIPETSPISLPFQTVIVGITGVVVVLSYWPVRNMVSSDQSMNRSYDPLHLVNTYGAFGSITKTRYELVFEGTNDEPQEDAEWREYEFPGKPTDTSERPAQIAPYHLRLDWHLWFAAMSRSPRRHPWVYRLVNKMLEGDEETLSLFDDVPFDDPPKYIRVRRFRYRYTTREERRESGEWWSRELVGTYVAPMSLEESPTVFLKGD